MQRLPLATRWATAEGLLSHSEDAEDANLPLMDWYGIEPLVPANPATALELATAARIPLVREFVARRVVDDAAAKGEKADLGPLVAALARSDEKVARDLLKGAREGLRGRKSMRMPDGWPAVYVRLSKSDDRTVRELVTVLALIFGDPQALADLRKLAQNATAPSSERVAALEALIEKRASDLAPVLHEQLTDPSTRRSYRALEPGTRIVCVGGRPTGEPVDYGEWIEEAG